MLAIVGILLVIGMVFVNVLKPGSAIHATAAQLDPKAVAAYTTSAAHLATTDFLMNIIPSTVVDAFARGEILQVLLFSMLFGLALLRGGDRLKPLVGLISPSRGEYSKRS